MDTDGGTCEVQAGDQGTAVCGDHMQGREVRWWGCRGGGGGGTKEPQFAEITCKVVR